MAVKKKVRAEREPQVRVERLVTPLSREEIVASLEEEITTYQNSYREADGWIHDEGATKKILSLRAAINCVKAV